MNYYEHHIGDYAAATSHLSFVEDAAYSRLLRIYYRDEKPLPPDLKAVIRLAGARSKDEREAVETVLSEFFTLQSDGWHSKRADAEIARYAEKREKAARSANARWKQCERIAEPMRSHSERNAIASETHDERNAHQSPVTRQEQKKPPDGGMSTAGENPPTADLGGPVPAIPECPHSDIVSAYHEILPELARVRTWDSDRQKFLRGRWREDAERQSVEWWRDFFRYVRTCPLLMGQVERRDAAPWAADLEWLVRPSNFRKVIEGRYEARAA